MIDLGAIFGSAILGYASDRIHGRRSVIAMLSIVCAMIISWVITLQMLNMSEGFFINSLNNLVSSACAADLGKQHILQGNERAISTITGIIDGTGSAGSALG